MVPSFPFLFPLPRVGYVIFSLCNRGVYTRFLEQTDWPLYFPRDKEWKARMNSPPPLDFSLPICFTHFFLSLCYPTFYLSPSIIFSLINSRLFSRYSLYAFSTADGNVFFVSFEKRLSKGSCLSRNILIHFLSLLPPVRLIFDCHRALG